MLISIFASVWAKNLWDELILKNEIELLRLEYLDKKPKFIVFSYDHKNPFYEKDYIEYKPYFPDDIKNKKKILTNLNNFLIFLISTIKSDLIVIWWGGLFFDNEVWSKKNPLNLWIFRKLVFSFLLKKIYFFRVGISLSKPVSKDKKDTENISYNKNLKKIKKIFKKSFYVSVRDNNSFELLKEIWIDSEIKNDPVFFDKWIEVASKSFVGQVKAKNFDVTKVKDFDFSWQKVWIAFRSWYLVEKSNMSDRMEEWKLREIINYITTNGWKIVLLPHSFTKTDNLSNDHIFLSKFVWDKVKIKNSMQEVYKTYKNKQIDICFSMRLHSVILSHVYEIPFVWVSYSKKTDEVLESLN